MHRFLVVLALWVVVPCAGCATSSAASESPAGTTPSPSPPTESPVAEPITLPFAWPAGASAIVTERVVKKGRAAKLVYRIDVGDRTAGGITVQITSLKFLELEGFNLKDPEIAPQLALLESQATAAMPAFLVSPSGVFEDVTDYEGVVDMVERLQPHKDHSSMREAMRDPAYRELLRQGISKIWFAWAGIWVGESLAVGRVLEVERHVQANGATHTFPVTFEHKGPSPGRPGYVDLVFTSKLEGESARAMTRSIFEALSAGAPKDPQGAREMQEAMIDMSVSTVRTIHATVDASTLLPLRSESQEVIALTISGERHETLERHAYQFDWTLPRK